MTHTDGPLSVNKKAHCNANVFGLSYKQNIFVNTLFQFISHFHKFKLKITTNMRESNYIHGKHIKLI